MPSIVPSPPRTMATSACLPIACTVCAFHVVEPDAFRRRKVEQHPCPGRLDDARDREQRLADAFRARLAEQGDMAECLRHRPIMQDAPTCLYYLAALRRRGNRHRICA